MLLMGKNRSVESLRFLVVDDHEKFRELVIQFLELGDDQYRECSNGREALEACQEEIPDCILMDLEMPVMDGMTAVKVISADYPEVKVIMLSQHDHPDLPPAARRNGAFAYLTKDNLNELSQCIQSAVTDGTDNPASS